MESTKTSFLRLATINSDESKVAAATRTVALLNPDTGRPLDGVTAVVRLMSDADFKEVETENRQPEKGPTGKVAWKSDTEAVVKQVLVESVQSWSGIVGADNRPMPLCAAALLALDGMNRTHLAAVARTPAEVVDAEVVAESFREPAGVGPVAH